MIILIALLGSEVGATLGASPSYRIMGFVRGIHWGAPTSPSFKISEGFLRKIYFPWIIFAPIVTGITPNTGVNIGPVEITDLAGANFQAGAGVKLSKSGQPEIAAASVTVVSPGKITCTFDITGAAAGLWDVTVTNPDGRSGTLPSAFKIVYSAPAVTSITPARGLNNEVVNITNLAGSYFRSGAAVKLSKTGETDIIAENVVVESANKITCRFNLSGKAAGLWDVTVTNDDNQSGALAQGFKIEAPVLEIVGPIQIRPVPPGAEPGATPSVLKPMSIAYNLSKDAEIIINVYNMRGEKIWSYTAVPGSSGGQAGLNQIIWDGVTAFKSIASAGVYILHVTSRVDGQTKILAKEKFGIVR